jgi:hypothetical protein
VKVENLVEETKAVVVVDTLVYVATTALGC